MHQLYTVFLGNKEKELNLLNVSQTSRIEMFGLTRDELEVYDSYKSYIYLVWELTKEMGLPIR